MYPESWIYLFDHAGHVAYIEAVYRVASLFFWVQEILQQNGDSGRKNCASRKVVINEVYVRVKVRKLRDGQTRLEYKLQLVPGETNAQAEA